MIDSFTQVCRFFLVVVLFQSLLGCGQGDSDNSDETQSNIVSSVNINAEDVSTFIYKGETEVINLANVVHSSDNSPIRLNSVDNLASNASCDDVQLGDLNVAIDAQTSGVCVYQYSVSDKNDTVEQKGLLQVTMLEKNAKLTTLDPVIYSIDSGKELTIALDAKDVNLTLQSDVSLVGTGKIESIDTQTNEIQYIASEHADDAGVSRLIYSFSDTDGNLSVGNVFIAVSTYTNSHIPPTFDFRHGEFSSGSSGQDAIFEYFEIETNQLATIDIIDYFQPGLSDSDGNVISDCDATSPSDDCVYLQVDSTSGKRYLKDSDGDFLQLIDVRVFNAYAQAEDPTVLESNDFVASIFQFSAPTPGYYTATYTLTDHKGGLAIGLINIKVVSQLKDVYVEASDTLFLSPINYQQAQDARIKTVGSVIGDGVDALAGTEQPIVLWDNAQGMCQSMGARLPTSDELASLYEQEGNLFASDNAKWSVQESYWSSTVAVGGEGFVTYDLKTGVPDVAIPLIDDGKLVTCVVGGDTNMEIRIPESGELHAESEYQLSVQYNLFGQWINYTNSGLPWTWTTDYPELFTVDNSGYLSTHDIHGEGYVSVYLTSAPSVTATSGRFYIEHEIISQVYGDIRSADSKYPSDPVDGTRLAAAIDEEDPQMLLRCGSIVDAFGVRHSDGSESMVGGSGGDKDDIPMLGVSSIRVEWGNYYNDKQGGGTEILSMRFEYTDGKYKQCGNYNDSKNKDKQSDTFYLREGYELIGLHLYGNKYGHAIQFYTRVEYK
ncbi:beta-prism lectin domain-containing protein [Vibrio sp. MA40-2]|uniref:beta-prism lectin domain-containing protein n=1 Tax=Vibrio sp. MA40-2 TaxID=3391828 RepID=UPI0039A5B019